MLSLLHGVAGALGIVKPGTCCKAWAAGGLRLSPLAGKPGLRLAAGGGRTITSVPGSFLRADSICTASSAVKGSMGMA